MLKWSPNGSPNLEKSGKKRVFTTLNFYDFRTSFFIDFGPKQDPKSIEPELPFCTTFRHLFGTRPREGHGPHFNGFWMDFGTILERFGSNFGAIPLYLLSFS